MKLYSVCMTLKAPNDQGKQLDILDKVGDIIYAIESFNKNFKGKKQLKLFEITTINEIIMFLRVDSEPSEKIDSKQLSYFSKRLYHDKNWKQYSRIESKLFTVDVFEEITDTKEIAEINNEPIIPKEYLDMSAEEKVMETKEVGQLSDQESLDVFKALLSIQNIGDGDTIVRRKKNIEEIKALLIDAVR